MKKILVIDDEETLLEIFPKMIRRLGAEAVTAKNGIDGVQMYKDHRPDAVLLDIRLPDMYGEEVFKEIRAFDPQAKIFFISASESEISAAESGAQGYLVKPVFIEQIQEVIEKI